ncbi:hypothetical protein [Hymenobacter sp.]|jgi:hypothetical protein|uniref:hypothetical protein n=1 Tax=Hymenobacter sp. TaxID=1898978 RepID=UPI002ED95B01
MKKPRGTKRLLRSLEKQSANVEQLDMSGLLRSKYSYRKLKLGQWHTTSAVVPLAIRQQAVGLLLATMTHWHQQLQLQPEPFYSALWIFEREFAHSSQVVAGIKERMERYQQLFLVPESESVMPLPLTYRQLPGADQLDWTSWQWEEGFEPEDFPNGWPSRMLRRPHRSYTDDTGREFLIVQTDRVWVGSYPQAKPTPHP